MPTTINLTGGFVAVVDDEDAELVSAYKWRVLKTWRSTYAQTTTDTSSGRKTLYMHRLIFANSACTGLVIDHINGDGLDNRRANLRECSIADNARNKSATVRNNSSGCTGVVWRKDRQAWQVAIVVASKKRHIGYFDDKQDAIKARLEAEQQHFGTFAPTYIPPALQELTE